MTFSCPTLSADLTPTNEWRTWREREFPVFRAKCFLNHGAVSALPRVVADAIAAYAHEGSTLGQSELARRDVYDECKARAAQLIGWGAQASEIAFCGSTSHALATVATSLPWQPGDNCVVVYGDFPTNVLAWRNLEKTHGVECRMVPSRDAMDVTTEEILSYVDERTRIVSVATCNFLSGRTFLLQPLRDALRARGVLLCADAIQTLGATQLDALPDFVCADAHKWLLGPNGIALLWVSSTVLPQLHPMMLGWLAVADRENWFSYSLEPHPTAERFEPGAHNMLGIFGLHAALQLLLAADPPAIEARVTALRDYAAAQLQAAGCRLLWTPDSALKGGIVTFQPQRETSQACFERLQARFELSPRTDRNGEGWVRISPHFMNDAGDIDALIAALNEG